MALRAGLERAVPPALGFGKSGESRGEEPRGREVARASPDYSSQPAPPGCGRRAAAGALARAPSGAEALLLGVHHTPGSRRATQARVKGERPG